MAKRTDIKKILIIGSGPIVIGQAAEFDYAGTQACLALKEEGYEVVRSLLLPSDMGVKPYFIASLTSSIEKSPSGPISTVMPSLEACSFSLLAVSKKSTLGISS